VRGLITNDAAALEINQANQSWVLDPGALIKLDSIPESKSANVVRITAAGVSITGRGTIQGAVPPLGSEPQDYNQAIVQVAGVTGVTIEDIRIVGNRSARAVSASMPSYSHDGVFASSGSDGLRVREINVKTVGGRGIRVFNCDDVALDANSFLNPYADAINCNVGPTASHSLRVSDNYIDKTGVPQPVAGLVDDGIKVVGQINTVDPAQSKLYESIIVTGNTVRLPSTFLRMLSIEIFGGARHVSTVANSTSGGNMGISYNNVQFGSVRGNVVKSPQYRGIELADVFDTTASGNSLFGGAFGQEGIGCSATNVAAEFHQNKNLVATGNSIAGFTETGILYAGVMHGVIGCNGIDMSTSTASAAPNAYGVWCKISSSNSIYNIPTDNVTICGNVVIGSGTGSGRNNVKVGFFLDDACFPSLVCGNVTKDLASPGPGKYVVLLNRPVALTANHVVVGMNTSGGTNAIFDTQGTGAMSNNIRLYSNTGEPDTLNWNTQVTIRSGDVPPDGSGGGSPVISGMGSLWLVRSGSAGTKLWVKQSGPTNLAGSVFPDAVGWTVK